MKRIYFLFSLILLSEITFSQLKLELTKENNNPDFIEFHLPFLCLDFAPSNSNFYGDFGMSIKKKNFYVDIEYRISYVNGLEEYYYNRESPEAYSIYYSKSPKSLLVNFGYIIKNEEEETEAHFHLKTSGKVAYYISAPTTRSNMILANLGIKKGFTWVNCANKDLDLVSSNNLGFTPPSPEIVSTMMDYTYLQIGVSNIMAGYWEANIETYGKRKTSTLKIYYGNILILVNSEIDPILYGQPKDNTSSDLIYSKYDLNKSKRSSFGFNMGASLSNISRFGISMGAEFGYLPGIKGSLTSNLSLTITSKIYIGRILN